MPNSQQPGRRKRVCSTIVVILTVLTPLSLMVLVARTQPTRVLSLSAAASVHTVPAATPTARPKGDATEEADSPADDRRVQLQARHDICLLYDKAPRTGSTTIAKALERCWRNLGVRIPAVRHMAYSKVVSAMLDEPQRVVGVSGVHYSILDADVNALAKQCVQTVYITSTRDMRARLLSEAKYRASQANIRINTTVTQEDYGVVWRELVERQAESESKFEKYPFRQTETLRADYVVRADRLNDDLGALLRAFGCAAEFRTSNVHALHEDASGFQVVVREGGVERTKRLEDIVLKLRDERHTRLARVAEERNDGGIEKVLAVVKSMQSMNTSLDGGVSV